MEQFNDIRNVLRNPDDVDTEPFVAFVVNHNMSVNCLTGESVTFWVVETNKDAISLWKILKFVTLPRQVFTVNESSTPLIKFAHIHHHLKSVSVLKPSYSWFLLKRNASYHSKHFDYAQIEEKYQKLRLETVIQRTRDSHFCLCKLRKCLNRTSGGYAASLCHMEQTRFAILAMNHLNLKKLKNMF